MMIQVISPNLRSFSQLCRTDDRSIIPDFHGVPNDFLLLQVQPVSLNLEAGPEGETGGVVGCPVVEEVICIMHLATRPVTSRVVQWQRQRGGGG